jgi:eukaryotic-like serine/threonine-protein kinase
MTPDRYRAMRQLFDAAAELGPAERERLLGEAQARDAELAAEVRRLLAADDAALIDIEAGIAASLKVGPGTRIGAYTLLSRLGEGGMGEVWLAEQGAPLKRRVAIKMIKAGMDTRQVIARFEAERQALARLEHPAIARVIDAGETALGRPYFVMEYVDGLPINEFCDQQRLSVRKRLQLFRRACEGVQHAHNKALIHRDLKPSNILVCLTESGPQPKIIDFGVAKALAAPAAGAAPLTLHGQPVGTPEYMSPEQRAGGEHAVDTRVDVYALGVILYELLAGQPPATRGTAGDADAIRPSVTLGRSGRADEIAAARGTDARQLAGTLRGDLDWIVLRAMAPDREHRFATPAALAADVEHYLASRPVSARPPTARYVASRFVRRHRVGVAVAVLLGISLLAGVTGISLSLQRALEAEEIARREAATASETLDFVVALFKGADPMGGGSASATAREIVEEGARRIAATEFTDPLVEARLSQVVGDVLTELAQFDAGLEWLGRAREQQTRLLGPEHDDTLRTAQRMAFAYWARGPVEAAEAIQRRVLDARLRRQGPDDPATLDAGLQLLSILGRLGHDEEVRELAEAFAGRARQALGTRHPTTLDLLMVQAGMLSRADRHGEAESLYLEVLEARRAAIGPRHVVTRATEAALATVYMRTGRLAEAEELLDAIGGQIVEQFGPDHKAAYRMNGYYGELRRHQGRLEEAAALQRQMLAGFRALLDPGHPDIRIAEQALVATLEQMGIAAADEPLLAER